MKASTLRCSSLVGRVDFLELGTECSEMLLSRLRGFDDARSGFVLCGVTLLDLDAECVRMIRQLGGQLFDAGVHILKSPEYFFRVYLAEHHDVACEGLRKRCECPSQG